MKIFTLIFLTLLVSCNQSVNKVQSGSTENIDVTRFAELMAGDVQILDVRTAGEFSQGFIEGALNLDVQQSNFINSLAKLNKEQPVLLYCRSGLRSAKAMAIMNKQGFAELYNLKGGYLAWASAQH